MSYPNVILGLWPIAGVTTIGVTSRDARATIAAAIDSGITTFDSAFSYGYDGESDRSIGEFLRADRDSLHIIGKVGQRWTSDRTRVVDASPDTLTRDAETSLRRMGIDRFDLLMLHSPDPQVPLETSAGTISKLKQRGLCRQTGLCNATVAQRQTFSSAADCEAIQCPLNLLQQDALSDRIADAQSIGCEAHVYWTLMKGLLAGKISRNHVFDQRDSRPNYPIFQGAARRRAHRIVDRLREIGQQAGLTPAQLSIGWALAQPGVTAALVGGHRPEQIRETASARALDHALVDKIDQIIAQES